MFTFGDARLPERFWNFVYPEPNSGCWLWAGSLGDARNAAKTHCPRGHELSGDNLMQRYLKAGSRRCKTCDDRWSLYNHRGLAYMKWLQKHDHTAFRRLEAAAGRAPGGQ